jgi:hypothetical protein
MTFEVTHVGVGTADGMDLIQLCYTEAYSHYKYGDKCPHFS